MSSTSPRLKIVTGAVEVVTGAGLLVTGAGSKVEAVIQVVRTAGSDRTAGTKNGAGGPKVAAGPLTSIGVLDGTMPNSSGIATLRYILRISRMGG